MKGLIYFILLGGLSTLCACNNIAGISSTGNNRTTDGNQWLQANKLFERNVHWRGSDDAYSIQLGADRVLWLFGDTLISSKDVIAPRDESYVKMPRNSIGIMHGLDPAAATINFYWGNDNSPDNPKSFFINSALNKTNWLWPGNGALLPNGKTLVLFFMNIKTDNSSPWGFAIAGWQAAKITNISLTPDKRNILWLPVSDYKAYEIMLGSGGVIVEGDYLYAYGGNNAKIGNNIYLARWPLSVFNKKKTDLSNPEWWAGKTEGWVKESIMKEKGSQPEMTWDKGQNEFTVNKLSDGTYVMVQNVYSSESGQPGNSNLVCRTSKALTGPWSEQKLIYKNLYRVKPAPKDLNVYAGKYHPELKGAEVIFTFASNTLSLKTLWNWQNIYWPSFLKMDMNDFLKIVNGK